MFERYTDRARQLLMSAQQLGRDKGHDFIGTEHLLHSMLNDSDSEATVMLRALGVDCDALQLSLEGHLDTLASVSLPPTHLPFSLRAKKAVERALRESLGLYVQYVGPEHLLLAILYDEESEASKMLGAAGVDRTAILRELKRPRQSAATGDGRVRITQDGNVITITVKADATVDTEGYAFGSEAYVLRSQDEHVITITLAG